MKLLSLFSVALLLLISCKKEDKHMADAIITGADGRMCMCCGGFMITFNGETEPYKGIFKLINNGEQFGLSEKDSFPVYVKVDWKVTDSCGDNDRIELTSLVRK